MADLSAFASAFDVEEVAEDRMPHRGDKAASEEYGWWFAYGPDSDFDGLDDRLEEVIAGKDSPSPTSIIGDDGHNTVAIIVDFAWHPTDYEIEQLVAILENHGWESEGSWFQVMDSIDSIVVDHVPVSAILEIHALESVVVVEMQNVMTTFLSTASPASRVRPSEVYGGTLYDRGYTGEGIVIAVLDSGVDNEHRSLNDFDDQDDDPDLDANSYDDQKWVAGYDATSQASNPDGSQDPDDGQGHGTHVAGIALGTGDARGIDMGTAPGAYLVDVKVLTDSGGTNSQNSINGIQWVINNRDTNWGNGAIGIQIAQMSFGSIGNQLDPNDDGDNGTGAEARLVNNATANGISCIVAAGNDGKRRIPSPASADGAITIGSAEDRGTINRTDDNMASYSNSGPRNSDNDGDDWDELKPDISAYGSDMMSASAATGTSFPGSPRPMADNGYEEKDGTSMATPLVSGIVALMLQAESSLTPEEIKDILRNSSEQRGDPDEPDVSDRWNADWGFGLVDASCAVDTALQRACTPLDGGGGGVIIDPPPSNDSDLGAIITSPNNGTWMLVGEMMRISGGEETGVEPWDSMEVKLTQHHEDFSEVVLMDWTAAGGQTSSWYLDVLVKEDWVSETETYVVIEARAVNSTEASASDVRWGRISRMMVSFGSPSSGTSISDTVTFSGSAQGIEADELHYRVGSEEWLMVHTFDSTDNEIQDWSFTWDSTEVDDGSHRISIKMVNLSGLETDVVRRTFTVDNQPAAPALKFQSSVEILDQDLLPATSAVAGTVLEIHFSVVNTGDADASDLHLSLDAPGSDSNTYPSEGKLPTLAQGETRSVILWWWATDPGDHTVTLNIDPNGLQNEIDISDNSYSFQFLVEERPVEPTLRFLTSAVTTSPSVPSPPANPDNPVSYKINVRVDNLGQTDATSIIMTLYTWEETGWQTYSGDRQTIAVIGGSTSGTGNSKASFTHSAEESGTIQHRVILEGNGVDAEHSELRFNVIVDGFEVSSPTRLTLSEGESAIGFAGIDGGGLLFTTINGELHARTLTPTFGMPGDTLIESDWTGEFAFIVREDGRAQVTWTRRFQDGTGYTLYEVRTASIGASGDLMNVMSHMTPIKQSEGEYWGLDLAEKDGRIVLAGYHRDISTGGSWLDVTNIFLIVGEDGDSNQGWFTRSNVITDVDINPQFGNPIAVGIGEKYVHILYQAMRDDVTGQERVGLFYAHGEAHITPWSFQSAVGDNAAMPELMVIEENNKDVLIAGWVEHTGRSATINTAVTDSIWSLDSPTITPAPGATKVVILKIDDGIRVLHDEVGVYGPVVRYGLRLADEPEVGHSNLVGEGHIVGAGDIGEDGIIVSVSPSGTVNVRKMALINPVDDIDDGNFILDMLLEPLPGDNEQQKMMVLVGITIGLFTLLACVVIVLRKTHEEELELEVSTGTGDIELLVEPEEDAPLVAIDADGNDELVISTGTKVLVEITEEEVTERDLVTELEAKVESGTASKRLERRMKRKEERETKEAFDKMISELPPIPLPGELPSPAELPILTDLPPPPAPGELPLPMPPAPGMMPLPPMPAPTREVSCGECSATVTVKDMTLRNMDCPICSATINM